MTRWSRPSSPTARAPAALIRPVSAASDTNRSAPEPRPAARSRAPAASRCSTQVRHHRPKTSGSTGTCSPACRISWPARSKARRRSKTAVIGHHPSPPLHRDRHHLLQGSVRTLPHSPRMHEDRVPAPPTRRSAGRAGAAPPPPRTCPGRATVFARWSRPWPPSRATPRSTPPPSPAAASWLLSRCGRRDAVLDSGGTDAPPRALRRR